MLKVKSIFLTMPLKLKLFLSISFLCLIITIISYFLEATDFIGPFLSGFFVSLAVALGGTKKFKGFSFSIWIFAAVTLAMFYPASFQRMGSFEFKSLIVPLLQIIMFGMGTAMSIKDFAAVIKTPKAVFIGLLCQFTIMPIVGFGLATTFGFDAEIAAGIILIGSSPSGLASNVMAFIGKANLALSVTLTAVATLLAPLVTPLLMKLLAGQLIEINVLNMMWGIVKIVIIPILAGLLFNKLMHGKAKWLDDAMPLLSMVGIAVIIAIITASGRDSLLEIGMALILACLLHNSIGYFLGYWSCRLFKMDEKSCRTIALEVGLQNAGLASGIALQLGRVSTLGLAAAVFGPMMNITGSTLASWWRGKPIKDESHPLK